MNVNGYDLSGVNFKLKRATEILIEGQLDEADELLTQIKKDLKGIEVQGPEHLRRERELAWLEMFGNFIQQIAIVVVITLLLLRLKFVKLSIYRFQNYFSRVLKLSILFSSVSIFWASIGLIRYGPSSWSSLDLQVIFVGISGLIGGVWVGIITGIVNSVFRIFFVPQMDLYLFVPAAAGIVSGALRQLNGPKPLPIKKVILGGSLIALVHSFVMYLPIYRYLPLSSLIGVIFSIVITETAVVLLFFLLVWQIFKEEKARETERELLRSRLLFLQAQINPHFLFNTLGTIAAVCGEEKASRARQLTLHLSDFFRRITDRETDFVPLQDELEFIDAYLEIEKIRFGNRLEIEKNIHLSPQALQLSVPILILQPIVENAVKHGISKKRGGGKLTLSARTEDSKTIVEIKDTGIGMTEEEKQKLFQARKSDNLSHKTRVGIGISNIRERLSRCYGEKFQMSVESVPDQGTTVRIELPLNHD
jgi:two-component system LytT family sensor kinase